MKLFALALATVLLATAGTATAADQADASEAAKAAPTGPLAIDLICSGDGRARRTVTFGTTRMKPGELPQGPLAFSGDITFRGTARVRIREDGSSAVLLPREMLSDGKLQLSGYKEIRKMAIGSELIEGKVAISVVYQPRLTLDRRTGELAVAGSQNSYTAKCKLSDTVERQF